MPGMTTPRPPLPQPTFGELLRCWRRNRHLSQGDFGALLAPHARHSTVSCWELGIRRPSLKYLRQIVALTGISLHLALGADQPGAEAVP